MRVSGLGTPPDYGKKYDGYLRCRDMRMYMLRRWRFQSFIGQKSKTAPATLDLTTHSGVVFAQKISGKCLEARFKAKVMILAIFAHT